MKLRRFYSHWFLSLMLSVVMTALLEIVPSTASGQSADARGFVDRVYRDAAGEHKYVVFVPENYSSAKKWPVILFLHGAGERGRDGRLQTTVGLGPYVKANRKRFPFIVVFPQCENVKGRILTGWSSDAPDGKRAVAILDEVEKQYSIDKSREILTGWSKGGYGAWSLAVATPERWAAVVPLSGGGDVKQAARLKNVPVWAFHGANDQVVLPSESRQMIAALKAAGGHPRYSEVPNVGHDIWRVAYGNDDLYTWMSNPRKLLNADIPLQVKPGHRQPLTTAAAADTPFVPAVVIPQAAYVRLGNEMLATLADAIPKIAPRDLLAGRIDDFADYTAAEGRTFRVDFTGIRYNGQLTRARVQATRRDRLNIQLGLENATITIGTTYVTGRDHSATAGPISVVLGHRRPVWLSIDVTPAVERRQLRLKMVGTKFSIPNDNWYVTSPAGVSTHGFGMTREKVSNGLVSGVYGSKARIESEVEAIVPSLIKELEQHLELADVNKLVASIWPLPVYKPRVQLWPEDVATDDKGVSLVFSVAAAAVDSQQTPKTPRVAAPAGFVVGKVPQLTSLQVGVAPNMLQSLTDLLIQADVARIHLLDIPGKSFEPLSVSKALAEAAPDFKRYGKDVEVWAELILARPVTVDDTSPTVLLADADDTKSPLKLPIPDKTTRIESTQSAETRTAYKPVFDAAHDTTFQFKAPKLLISYAIKPSPQNPEWTPYAEFEIELAQKAQASIQRPSFGRRAVRLDWFGAPDIKVRGRFAPGYKPINSELHTDRIKQLFARGWGGWIHTGPVSQVEIPDVDFGFTKLRISDVGWSTPYLYATFSAPGIRIANRSEQTLVYETKGPYSGWGGPYTLKPGEVHDYEIAYPMLYRRRTGNGINMYTLPVGSHSEFRVPNAGGAPSLFHAREGNSDGSLASGVSASGK